MNKEIRKELKWIEGLDTTYNHTVEVISNKGHYKVRWKAVDPFNQLQTCTVVLGSSPSCHRWIKNHRRNVKRELRKKNISFH
jgi:hypothetical protein